MTTGWGVSVHPEETVGESLWPPTTLHTRRQLIAPACSEVVIIVTGLLSGHKHKNTEKNC